MDKLTITTTKVVEVEAEKEILKENKGIILDHVKDSIEGGYHSGTLKPLNLDGVWRYTEKTKEK